MPHTFGNDERVAAKDDRDVMVPAGKAPAFVVVEPEFVFEILIRAFDSPALHHSSYELLLRRSSRQRAEETVRWRVLVVAPFDQQPDRLALLDATLGVVVRRDDTAERESRREVLLGTLTPGTSSESTLPIDAVGEVNNADDLVASTAELVEHHDNRPRIHRNAVVQPHLADGLAELSRASIRLIRKDETRRDTVVDGTSE